MTQDDLLKDFMSAYSQVALCYFFAKLRQSSSQLLQLA